ncbi:hypothetical protein M153_3100041461 [Pseudoloma neurophilia]|uniref:Uncharacterized protein n=1 Tax=Pseudoloma neurophilia TaxID=146866 RepID=A0A0R0M0K6_9MICR|nr:hypothetical protein M153_3100041461 [Pseudoloma neurophilia]
MHFMMFKIKMLNMSMIEFKFLLVFCIFFLLYKLVTFSVRISEIFCSLFLILFINKK